mmetsp:Transcript_30640/g.33488  ORF Transcript_30640/g.33488 Transcript_30640/m.33488 type:complete len:191 (-) Transcript_30640:144-716(-)|eukprot:gene1190-1264_t
MQFVSTEESLPENWEKVYTKDGRPYYYHKITRVTSWNPPKRPSPTQERLSRTNSAIEEAVQKRMQQYEEERKQQEERAAAAEVFKGEVRAAIERWRKSSTFGKLKDIGEMLSTLHLIIISLNENSVVSSPLNAHSNPSEIKKAFMKAARHIHPDKLQVSDLLWEEKLLAEEVFIVLNDEYTNYKKQKNLS